MDLMRLLTNMLAMAGFANFGYQDEFKKNFAVGESVRVKFPQEFQVVDGFDYNPQAINRQTTSITIDQPLQIAYQWDSVEEALKLERGRKAITENYNRPAMAQMASEFELRFMDFAFYNTNNVVGTLAAVPTSWDVYAQADQRMTENAGNRLGYKQVIGVTPAMMRTLVTNSLTQFNPPDAISAQYKTGIVGEAAGSTWYKSMYCHPHTTGVWTTQATGTTISGGGQSGNSLILGMTTGNTVLRGDIFNIAGCFNVNPRTKRSTGTLKQFKVMANAIAAASLATVSITPSIIGPGSPYQNVSNLPADTSICLLWPGTTMVDGTAKTGVCGQLFNKQAFAMAGVELMIPSVGGLVSSAGQAKDPNTGLSIAQMSGIDPLTRIAYNRLDSLIGFGPLYTDRAACLVASLT